MRTLLEHYFPYSTHRYENIARSVNFYKYDPDKPIYVVEMFDTPAYLFDFKKRILKVCMNQEGIDFLLESLPAGRKDILARLPGMNASVVFYNVERIVSFDDFGEYTFELQR